MREHWPLWIFFPLLFENKMDDGCVPEQFGTLRREQWERLERSHHTKNRATRR
jgi:hypothetical protein